MTKTFSVALIAAMGLTAPALAQDATAKDVADSAKETATTAGDAAKGAATSAMDAVKSATGNAAQAVSDGAQSVADKAAGEGDSAETETTSDEANSETDSGAQDASSESSASAESESSTEEGSTQEESTSSESNNQEQSQSGGNTAEQLDMGSSELGQPYTDETFGDWELRCINTDQEVDPCQLYQLLDDGEGTPVAEFSIFRLPEGQQAVAGATVIVPLETALQQQLSVAVDGSGAKKYPFAFCNPVGCYARIGFTEDDVNRFKRGAEATLTIVPALGSGQTVDLSMSLSGFTAGYDSGRIQQQ